MSSTKGEYLSPYKEVGLSAKAARLGLTTRKPKKRYHHWINKDHLRFSQRCSRCGGLRSWVGKKPCGGRA